MIPHYITEHAWKVHADLTKKGYSSYDAMHFSLEAIHDPLVLGTDRDPGNEWLTARHLSWFLVGLAIGVFLMTTIGIFSR